MQARDLSALCRRGIIRIALNGTIGEQCLVNMHTNVSLCMARGTSYSAIVFHRLASGMLRAAALYSRCPRPKFTLCTEMRRTYTLPSG